MNSRYPNLVVKPQGITFPIISDVVFPSDHKVLAVTGHRPNKLGNDYAYTSLLMSKIYKALNLYIDTYQPDFMVSGMALGIDTVFAQIAIKRQIPLVAAIPFDNQPSIWAHSSRIEYYSLLRKAILVVNVSGQIGYENKWMQLRNEWMVDHCNKLIAVWNRSPGGTANCVKYAQSVKPEHDILIINPDMI